MTLDEARTLIIATLGRMNAIYTGTLFDEWVLVSMKPDRGTILAYGGPRAESFKKTFNSDIHPLRAEMSDEKLAIGDFIFAAAAAKVQHDACMRIGGASYLFCNNTTKTMNDIRQNPLWRDAQVPFVKMSEQFRDNPVE
ncbi:MAG TPA: hypothetical protein VFJ90_04050 [Candidatus Didemnitutus sp.]|nr:hypothetical protein [Candidatus Didemnitutus sp.]